VGRAARWRPASAASRGSVCRAVSTLVGRRSDKRIPPGPEVYGDPKACLTWAVTSPKGPVLVGLLEGVIGSGEEPTGRRFIGGAKQHAMPALRHPLLAFAEASMSLPSGTNTESCSISTTSTEQRRQPVLQVTDFRWQPLPAGCAPTLWLNYSAELPEPFGAEPVRRFLRDPSCVGIPCPVSVP
jgi:hypothetical protein